ncbi:16S rRNA m(7)G-527 methyltransferase [Lachnospiraceae bacterium RM5]|nr:16S rRNA m(7)G-527 methyltransferase [Lachnospiraceae bacterium RM5]
MDKDFLVNSFEKIGISLENEQIDKFNKYYELLFEKNKVMNLTGITEYKDVVIKHFLDSVLTYKSILKEDTESIIDIGTGAGFPGIPLKIIFPEKKFLLLDSLNKRINFLNEVIENLELKEIDAVHGRAEELGHKKEYREKFDLCVSRAVSNLSTLSEYTLPFIKVNGRFISYKANNSDEEIDNAKTAIKILGGKIIADEKINLPSEDEEILRRFIIIKKIKNTEKKYPRKAGIPQRNPL